MANFLITPTKQYQQPENGTQQEVLLANSVNYYKRRLYNSDLVRHMGLEYYSDMGRNPKTNSGRKSRRKRAWRKAQEQVGGQTAKGCRQVAKYENVASG
jgi:hypothetical protein